MRRIISIITAAVMAILPMICTAPVSAYEQPYGIRLSIENKEININDIPENRKVALEIYLDNAPSFRMISFFVKKDSRTEYQYMNDISLNKEIPTMGSYGFGYGRGETPDIISTNIWSKRDCLISHDGCIAYVNLILPENVSAGDFYSVEFVPYDLDSYGDKIEILLEDDWDSLFGIESFSEFNNGGIYITQDNPPEPEPQQPPQEQNNEGENNNNSGNENNGGDNNDEKKETTAATTSTTTVASTTSTTNTTSTTEKTTTLTETETEAETTASEAETETTTEAVTTTTAVEQPKKKNGIIWLVIAAAAAAFAGITGAVIIVKKKSE